MKINFRQDLYNSQNRYSFKGKRLFALNLIDISQKGKQKIIPAYFTQIDKTDIPDLQQLQYFWKDTDWGNQILTGIFNKIDDPTSKNLFFMIECPQFSDLTKRIKALSATYLENNTFASLNIQLLQSANEIKGANRTKGAATAIIRGLCKLVENNKNINSIDVVSAKKATNWYKHLNFQKNTNFPRYDAFTLRKNEIEELLETTQQKYGKITEVTK